MTELNEEHHAEPAPEWPEAATDAITDPSVTAIVAALGNVKSLPVAEHEAVYGELHDALLEALNDDAPDTEGGA